MRMFVSILPCGTSRKPLSWPVGERGCMSKVHASYEVIKNLCYIAEHLSGSSFYLDNTTWAVCTSMCIIERNLFVMKVNLFGVIMLLTIIIPGRWLM